MDNPLVSVVTPTKNRAKLLAETLDSVAAQTLGAWEHIVVDDGSDDGTAELMATRCAADPRVRYIRRDRAPAGANTCRNIGIRAAQAPLVVMLDSDDLLAADCLAGRVRFADAHPHLDFATFRGRAFVERPGDGAFGNRFVDRLQPCAAPVEFYGDLACFLRFELPPWIITSPIWRRESLLQLGAFDEALLSWQDIELHVRAICRGLRYARSSDDDSHIRWQHEETKTSVLQRRSEEHLNGALDVIDRLEDHVRRGPGLNVAYARSLCSLYFFVAERWVERSDLAAAKRTWRRIVDRGLGDAQLRREGLWFLTAKRLRLPEHARATHKWKRVRGLASEA